MIDRVNAIVSRIVLLIADLDTTDIMTLSGIIDEIEQLKKIFSPYPDISSTTESLLSILNSAIKGDTPQDLNKSISTIIEEIQREILKLPDLDNLDDAEKSDVSPEVKTNIFHASDADIVKLFLVEAFEKIGRAELLVLELENDYKNIDVINELFRCFHTIKGECGFLKLSVLGELTHYIENMLNELRDGRLEANTTVIELLLEGIDYSKQMLKAIQSGSHDTGDSSGRSRFYSAIENCIKGSKIVSDNQAMPIQANSRQEDSTADDTLQSERIQPHQGDIPGKKEIVDPIIKVRASRINFLVDMVGELLIAEGLLHESAIGVSQVKKITKSIQYAAMQLRTEKVRVLFNTMKRVVRDVSKKLNKDIEMTTYGDDLEIDRNLIENLEEPLMHMIRNSIHHGIEESGVRESRGKEAAGNIELRAERRGNSIVISIRDDGAGLDKEKILHKAVEKGIVTLEDVRLMSDNQIYNLIFMQGFSTSDKVDLISGRGVGMDIVKTVITKSRGKINIKTVKEQFTEFDLIFPLSTAIIDGMIVKIGPGSYIFPVANIIESVKIKKDAFTRVNERVDVLNLRGEIIPVIYTGKLLAISLDSQSAFYIAVIAENSDRKKFAFIVDDIVAKKEIVIKSLGRKFRNIRGISSGTVLSGGEIGLVLDVEELIVKSMSEGC